MTEKKELAKPIEAEVVEYRAPDVGELMRLGIEKGLDVTALEKLVELDERMARRRAEAEFNASYAKFQEDCPPVPKTKKVKVVKNGVLKYSFDFAPLDVIVPTVRPVAAKHGFSWSFDEVKEGPDSTVTCTLHHSGGHSRKSSYTGPISNTNPGMSDQQKAIGSSTVGQRQSLIQVLGLVTIDKEMADHIMAGEDADTGEVVSEDNVLTLDTLIHDKKANYEKFCAFFGVKSLSDLPLSRYKEAVRMLEAKK